MTDQLMAATDDELTALARQGDQHAIVELWTEHFPATLSAARRYAHQPRDAEEIASDAFAGMLAALASGKGPGTSVRGYLVTSVRNLAASRSRRGSSSDVLTDNSDTFDRVGQVPSDPVAQLGELGLVREAFAMLPRRWQTVLWRTAVDADSNVTIGEDMGISPNAVAALSRRARRGLRTAYLQVHVSRSGVAPECQPFIDGLADFVVNEEGAPAALRAHVRTCARCGARVAELRTMERGMGGLLGPAILALAPAQLVTAGSTTVGGAVAAGATAADGAAGSRGRLSSRWLLLAAAALVALVTVAVLWSPTKGGTQGAALRHTSATTSAAVTGSATGSATPVTAATTAAPRVTALPVTPPPVISPSVTVLPVQPPSPRPTRPAPTVANRPPSRPAAIDLELSGDAADTVMTVRGDVPGVRGAVTLLVTVPRGVSLGSTEGDWTACRQNGAQIACTGGSRASDRWSGSLHTTWPATLTSGPVKAQVSGRYASGKVANASVQTTWFP
ncbi:RNA polymerase sigma factor [Pedococcus sp. 5OH_020]|uniref:RNA polymerase sigma factor n=1 Tax=Pedococcus sp. 5OH_020 TaxID=2989814 RepID=UPI0022E9BC90|nr:sigma-70 family RNA polymerase sigma factor [Pedococcus sp. 5OH_020]